MRRAEVRAKVAVIDLKATFATLLTATALIALGTMALAQDAKTITTHGYSTYGDLKYGPDIAHLDYVNPNAPKGGEYSSWTSGVFDTFNPYSSKGEPAALANIAFESILTSTSDEISADYCYLCETMEYPEDLAWVIFHLRKDVTFSDGSPLTAEDVVYSHYKLLDEGLPSYASAVRDLIPTAEALDPYTVKFTFNPTAPKKDLIPQAGGTPVWSKAWMEANNYKLSESSLVMPIGSGPYMLDTYESNRSITYKRNEKFWGAAHPFNVGQNNFDKIRIVYFGDADSAMQGFIAGLYTFRQESSSLSWATKYDFPAMTDGSVVKQTLPSQSMPAATGMIFNLNRDQLKDRRVRTAIGMMFNFEWTNETLQYGLFEHRDSFWQGQDMEAKGKPEGRELELLESVKDKIDPAILTEDVVMAHASDGSRQIDRTNLRNALALMEEAGYVTGDDGLLRNAEGKTLDIVFLESRPAFDRVLLPYIENLKQMGVNITYNRIDPSQFGERLRTFDYDMIYGGYSNSMEEGIGITQRYGSEGLGDVFNPANYSAEAVDILAKSVELAKTREEMAAAVRAIDRIMRYDYFMVPAWYKADYWVAYYDFYEHPENLPPYALGDMTIWWSNAEKAAALKAAGAFE